MPSSPIPHHRMVTKRILEKIVIVVPSVDAEDAVPMRLLARNLFRMRMPSQARKGGLRKNWKLKVRTMGLVLAWKRNHLDLVVVGHVLGKNKLHPRPCENRLTRVNFPTMMTMSLMNSMS